MTGTTVDLKSARQLAKQLLDGMDDRWRHTASVAAKAISLAESMELDDDNGEILIAAAWLHDVGYAPELRVTGFHPLDGAVYLERNGWPMRVCGLVAHHSGARFVARARGLLDQLQRFNYEASEVTDALTYADQTTGPQGQPMRMDQRLAEVLQRHGPESPTVAVHHLRAPYLLDAGRRVEQRSTA